MKTYQVTAASIVLRSGNVKLTPAQAKARAHNLGAGKGGVYEIKSEICFKGGEQFGYDGNVGKALAVAMATPEEVAAAAEAEAREKARAEKAEKPGKGKAKAEAKADAEVKLAAEAKQAEAAGNGGAQLQA